MAINKGYDPYNSATKKVVTAPKATKSDAATRAMKNATSNPGVDPYNSHDQQSKKWLKAWKDSARRKAEKEAKQREEMGERKTPKGMSRTTYTPKKS